MIRFFDSGRLIFSLGMFVASFLLASAEGQPSNNNKDAEVVTTVDGKTFKVSSVVKTTDLGVKMVTDDSIVTVPWENFDKPSQIKLGRSNPVVKEPSVSEVDSMKNQQTAYDEFLENLRAIPKPIVVTKDFKASWPGGAGSKAVYRFYKDERFALIPARSKNGADLIQTLRTRDTKILRTYRSLPDMSECARVDLRNHSGMKSGRFHWRVDLAPVRGTNGVQKYFLKLLSIDGGFVDIHPPLLSVVLQKDSKSPDYAIIRDIQFFKDDEISVCSGIIKTSESLKAIYTWGSVIIDGRGNTSNPIFPDKSTMPDGFKLVAAVTAYNQFKMEQNFAEARIQDLESQIKSYDSQIADIRKRITSNMRDNNPVLARSLDRQISSLEDAKRPIKQQIQSIRSGIKRID